MKKVIGVMPLWDDEKNSIWMLPGGIRSFHFVMMKIVKESFRHLLILYRNDS